MPVLGLNWPTVYQVECEERRTLLENSALVYATITTKRYAFSEGIMRSEHRIVYYCSRFFLLKISYHPEHVPTDRWRIYGKTGYNSHDGHLRRVSGTNDAREDEVGQQIWVYDNTKFQEPVVDWATDSLRQMTWAERSAIKQYRKMLKEMEKCS